MILNVVNPETANLEKSYLNENYSAGVTSISVKNNDRFIYGDRIMIGEQGQEKTEIVTVDDVPIAGTALVITATTFSHEADTPVYKLRFDSARFYRSTNGGVSYVLLDTQPLDVDNANLLTVYDDVSGIAGYYYKMTVYHTISTLESDFTDPIIGTGWRRDQVGKIIDEVLQEVGDLNEQHVTRVEILGYMNDVNDDLIIDRAKPYEFLHTRTTLSRTASQNYVDYPTDSDGKVTMWKFDRMDYNFTDSSTSPVTDQTYTLTVIPAEEFRNKYQDNTDSSTTQSDSIREIALDEAMNRFRLDHFPKTSAGAAFYLYYWKYFNEINSEGDVIETPTPKIYKLYIKKMYYLKRAITEPNFLQMSNEFDLRYEREKAKYKAVDRRDAGTPRQFTPATDTIKGFRR